MTDDFSKYVELKTSGKTPSFVADRARSDGMNEITLLRMLREVFDLSLPDAKAVAVGGDALAMSQVVEPNKVVYWEGWTSTEGLYVMQATVTKVDGGIAHLTDHRRYLVSENEMCEIPIAEPATTQMRAAQLRKPFGERLAGVIDFVESLTRVTREAV